MVAEHTLKDFEIAWLLTHLRAIEWCGVWVPFLLRMAWSWLPVRRPWNEMEYGSSLSIRLSWNLFHEKSHRMAWGFVILSSLQSLDFVI